MMASSNPSDMELVTTNYIRTNYEKKYKQNVPMALKYLTLQFSNMIIGCKILTIKQDMELFALLTTKLPSIRRFRFLFRASDHKYSANKFHELCDDKGGTITIIKSNWGNIFGGFTSKSWKPSNHWGYEFRRDENAFLFLVKSDDQSQQIKYPLLLELRENRAKYAIHCNNNAGPGFAGGYDICIRNDCNKPIGKISSMVTINQNFSFQQSYGNTSNHKINICGGNKKTAINENLFQVVDYEVFQIL